MDVAHPPPPGEGGACQWLPVLNLQGGLVGRFAVQIFGDWSERVTVGVLRATITDRAAQGE